MRTHFVVHESFEVPGAFEDRALARGHDIDFTRPYEGDGSRPAPRPRPHHPRPSPLRRRLN